MLSLALVSSGWGLSSVVHPQPAFAAGAAGTITVSKKDIQEADGGWKLAMVVKLAKKPSTPHTTFRFLLTPMVIYETYLDDSSPNEKQRSVPQEKDVQQRVATLDVGFSDARGDIWNTTKFDFIIRRDSGYEAGEYRVEARDGEDHLIGQPFVLKLEGRNPVVDRRTMNMMGSGSSKKSGAKNGSANTTTAASNDAPADSNAAAQPAPAASAPATEPAELPTEIKEKPGGCGCELPGTTHQPWGAKVAFAGLSAAALMGYRRRRSSRRIPL